jgi:hypothetical protein
MIDDASGAPGAPAGAAAARARERTGATSEPSAVEIAVQSTICVSPTAPTPSTFPASSASGFTLDTTTSATRVCFSSITPRSTFCPYRNIIMYSTKAMSIATIAVPAPPRERPRSVMRSDCRSTLTRVMESMRAGSSPAATRRAPSTACSTARSRRSFSPSELLRPAKRAVRPAAVAESSTR